MRWSLPVLATFCLLLTLNDFLLSTHRNWNDARLAPSAALLRGYPVYDGVSTGPLLGNAYGPLAPLVFVPAVLLPSPSSAILAGVLITFLLYAAPVLLLLIIEGRRRRVLIALAFACFWLYTFKTPVLTGPAFWIHADAPALGFAMLSCALLYSHKMRRRPLLLMASAFIAVLAIGIKQPVVPLVVAIPIFLLLAEGRRLAGRYAALVTLSAAVTVGLLLALLVDFESMVFNAVTVPFLHPMKPGGAVPDALLELARRSIAPAAVVSALLVAEIARARAERLSPRAWLRENGWILLPLVALACLPISVSSRAKVGGAWNTMAPTLYFLLAGALAGVMRAATRARRLGGFTADELAKAFLLVCCVGLAIGNRGRLSILPDTVERFRRDPLAAAFRFVKSHPDQVYLPFNPLVSLMAEGKAHHFSWGLRSYELAGISVSDARIREGLPSRLRYVITNRRPAVYILSRLPEYTVQSELPELPGWKVLSAGPRDAGDSGAAGAPRPPGD